MQMQMNITLKDGGRIIAAAEVYAHDPLKPGNYHVKGITYPNRLKGVSLQTFEFDMVNNDAVNTGPWELIEMIAKEALRHEPAG